MSAVAPSVRSAPARDPAWTGRVFWLGLGAVLLWPLMVATEFKPWIFLEPDNLKVTRQFLATFWPLVVNAEFMGMVARETWRTVAMATAGVTLALGIAVPLALLSTRVLSVSALSGRMARGPFWLRQGLRHTPVAALLAMVVPEVFLSNGHLLSDWQDARLAAVGAALLYHLVRRGDVAGTIVIGTGTLLLGSATVVVVRGVDGPSSLP